MFLFTALSFSLLTASDKLSEVEWQVSSCVLLCQRGVPLLEALSSSYDTV